MGNFLGECSICQPSADIQSVPLCIPTQSNSPVATSYLEAHLISVQLEAVSCSCRQMWPNTRMFSTCTRRYRATSTSLWSCIGPPPLPHQRERTQLRSKPGWLNWTATSSSCRISWSRPEQKCRMWPTCLHCRLLPCSLYHALQAGKKCLYGHKHRIPRHWLLIQRVANNR